jgi:uncharacterized protein (TIGR00297 family)
MVLVWAAKDGAELTRHPRGGARGACGPESPGEHCAVPLPLAALVALVISLAAWRASLLTREGAAAACLVGLALLGGQGWPGAAILLAFFLPTSLVSRLLPDATARFDAKEGPRDGWQVAANGGAAALAAVVFRHQAAGLVVAAGALAAAAADTWATSWGAGSRRPPRSILNFSTVAAGSSGGVSWRGSAGGACGGAAVALVAAWSSGSARAGLITFLCGIGGMLLDSLLGAALQGRFVCPRCELPTERRIHRCGSRTRPVGGVAWLGNDGVNLLATSGAALAAWLLAGRAA